MFHTAQRIRGLPYKEINIILSLKLTHDTVHLSEKTIRHIYERHPADYRLCMACIDTIIQIPDFIGQEPHHPENFEVVKYIDNSIVLVAICAIPDEYGDYPVQSSYIIPAGAMQRRLRKKHLHRLS